MKSETKFETAICPHCGEDFDVKENGRYVCPECENYVDVDDWFDTPHVHQPDGDTCGWATTKWLLAAFGCEVPSDRALERELHVRKTTEGVFGAVVQSLNAAIRAVGRKWDWEGIRSGSIDGTWPLAVVAAAWRRGLRPVFPGVSGLIHYSEYRSYMEDVFARHGRFAMCYVNTPGGVTYAHWIGIEKFKGRVRVMDPCDFDYSPLSRHEAIRGRRVSIACMIGFVRE